MHRDNRLPPTSSNLQRAFQRRQANMDVNAVPGEGDRSLEDIEDYIDNNYNDIEGYVGNNDDKSNDQLSGFRLESPRYGWQDDHISLQRRTTSIHRNVGRSNGRTVEGRRQWTSYAATLSRQPLDQHVEKIVTFMQQDNTLTDETPEGEQLRREALRDMPQCLAVKKRVKRKFVTSISTTKALGFFQMLKYQIAMSWSHLKGNIRDFSYTFELWYSSLKRIEGNFGSGVASYFKFLRWLFLINVIMTVFCFSFVCIPQIVKTSRSSTEELTVPFEAMNLLTGHGYLDNSLLYYGFYSTGSISGYDIPKAYFFTMATVYIVIFISLSISMASSYRKSFIETRGGLQNIFAHKIFCSWDYSIATSKAASLKSKSIYNELKELISDVNRVKSALNCCEKFRIIIMQITAHIFALAVGLSAGWLMHYLLTELNDPLILPAVIINIVMIVIPMVFRLFASYEDYKNPKITLFVTLARTIFLEMAVIAILIYYWLKKAEENESKSIVCWENQLAQEVYRLILFDFFFSTLLMTLVDVAWYFVHKSCKSVDPPEFDIATNTLSLIYNQTLFWVGFYFSPLLGVMVVLKLFLTWYVRSFILFYFCDAPKKSWRAAQTESWFLIIIFLWSLVLLFVHGYHVFKIDSSRDCGPLRDTDFLNIQSVKVIDFLLKPGVVAIVLIAMALGVYYLRAIANAQIDMVYFLKHRLVLAAKDKEFLIQNINNITKGEFQYRKSDKQEDLMDPTKLAPDVLYGSDDHLNDESNHNATDYYLEDPRAGRY